MKKLSHSIILIGIIQLLLVSCDDFRDIFKPKDDPAKVDIYAPKNIDGVIELPTGSEIDISGCEILSVYGTADISGRKFNLDIESAPVQQMIYFTDEFGNILMLNFANDEQNLILNAQTTSVALIMLLLEAPGIKKDEWNDLESQIIANTKFHAVISEVEQLIESRTDLFSEGNTELITKCGNVVNDLIGSGKSALLDDDLSPLVVKTVETNLFVTNNGKAPCYQITVSKDGVKKESKTLDASSFMKISAANLLDWTWGFAQAPDPVSFNLTESGEYEIRASSIDTGDGFNSPACINTYNIIHNFLMTLGAAFPDDCVKKVAQTSYETFVGIPVELSKTKITDPVEVYKFFINTAFSTIQNGLETVEACNPAGEVTNTSPGESKKRLEKYFGYVVSGGRWLLKTADVIGKIETGSNFTAQLIAWAYQDMEIFFCRRNANNELALCDVPFRYLVCTIESDENVYNETVYAHPAPFLNTNCSTEDRMYSSKKFIIGANLNQTNVESLSFSENLFSIELYKMKSGKGANLETKLSINGEIIDNIIKSIDLKETIHNEYPDGYQDYSGAPATTNYKEDRVSILRLKNIEIPMNKIQSIIEFSTPPNNISYTFTSDLFNTHDVKYQGSDNGTCMPIRDGNYVEYLMQSKTQLYPNNVKITLSFYF